MAKLVLKQIIKAHGPLVEQYQENNLVGMFLSKNKCLCHNLH